VHDLLVHLRREGVPWVVEPLGRDLEGREVLRYVPGRTVGAAASAPPAFRTPQLLHEIGAWLRTMHAASASFPVEPRDWRRGRRGLSPGLVVCHNDLSPANLVLHADGTLAAVLDWDMAAPAHPVDDVAFAAWQLALRADDPLDVEAGGLAALADGYGVDPLVVVERVGARMAGAARVIRSGADAGDEGLQRLVAAGVPDVVHAEAGRFAQRLPALAAALNRRSAARPRA
jgi:Ser/Thr protein kinase RdoA (MazF antagonist)